MVKVYGGNQKMILVVINMKVTTNMIKKKVKDSLHGTQVIFIKVVTKMMKEMDLEKCFLLMVQYIVVIGTEVFNVDKPK